MYAWQRRSKKPLLPPRPTDFDDVLKLSESAKRLVLEEEEEETEKNALPRLENARASSPSFTVGDGEEGERCEEEGESDDDNDDDDDDDDWLTMKTKATEAFVKLEFKRASRWFGKALEKLQISESEEGRNEEGKRRDRASLMANRSLALLRANDKKEALEVAARCEEEDAFWHKGSYRKAEALYALGEFKEAAEAYETAKAKILEYKTEENDVDAAVNELDGKIRASKEKMEEMEELASIDEEANEWKKRARGDENKTEEEKNKAVDQAQLDAEARDRDPKVKALVDRAMELMNPKESGDDSARGDLNITKEMYDEYFDLCNKALAMEPEYYQLHFQVAIVYLRLGKVARSIETIQNALKYGQNFLIAHSLRGSCFESLGVPNIAELSYATGINVSFDNCESWIALASLLGTSRGEVTNAVQMIRAAYTGGPEGKFKEPQRHPILALLLGYYLDALGHDAEPAALFDFSLRNGGGVTPIFFKAAVGVTSGDIDADSFKMLRSAFEMFRSEARKSMRETESKVGLALDVTGYYKSIELAMHKLIPTQWKKLEETVYVYENILNPLKVLAPKTLYLTRENIASLSVEAAEEEEQRENAPGIVLKGGCRSYAGVPEKRVYVATSQEHLHSAIDAWDNVKQSMAKDIPKQLEFQFPDLVAQEIVRAKRASKNDKKFSLSTVVAVVPNARNADSRSHVIMRSNGFIVSFASKEGDCLSDEDVDSDEQNARFLTNRGDGGDLGNRNALEVPFDRIDAWANEFASDFRNWENTRDSLFNATNAVAKAVLSHVSDASNVIGDWTFAKHARARSPLFLELTFVIDEASEMPKLVTVDPAPSLSGHKKYGVATSSVTEVAEESKEKVNEYAYPIASGVCDAAWMFAFDALEDDLLEHERSDDAMKNFADGAVSFVSTT
jgi:predicted Zn-dependent protease